MEAIKIEVTGNIAKVIEKPLRITAGTVGLPVEFVFDSHWDNMTKVAVFNTGIVKKNMKIVDNATVVPIEALAVPELNLSIGVYGVSEDGSVATPTVWASVGQIRHGAVPGSSFGSDIGTAKKYYDLGEQAAEKADASAKKAESEASVAENAADRANASAKSAEASAALAGEEAEHAIIECTQQKNAAINARHYAEEAADRAEAAADRAESAGGGETIIVGIDEGEHATHTATEIYNAIQNNQSVVFRYDPRLEPSEFIPLTRSTPTLAVFSKTGYPTEFDIFDITIGAHGIVHYEASFSSELVKQAVEKVETDIAPVSYLPQELNPEQQAQARKNMNAATIDDTKAGADAWSSKNIVDRLCPAFTESGPAVTCEPVEGYPLEVVSKIEPVQSGTGDPSPDNIRPISGHSAVKLTRAGKNILNVPETLAFTKYMNLNCYIPAGTYKLTWESATSDKDAETPLIIFESESNSCKFVAENKEAIITLREDIKVVHFYSTALGWNASEGISATITKLMLSVNGGEYEPYRDETFEIDLGQTVYGGALDWNTGVLTVDRKVLVVDGIDLSFTDIGDDYWNLPHYVVPGIKSNMNLTNSHLPAPCFAPHPGLDFIYCRGKYIKNHGFENVDAFNAYVADQHSAGTPLQIQYDLEEPITIQLTPQEILALSGINTLYSDTGDTEVTGRANPVAIISNLQSRLAALEAAVVNNA